MHGSLLRWHRRHEVSALPDIIVISLLVVDSLAPGGRKEQVLQRIIAVNRRQAHHGGDLGHPAR